MICVCMFLFGKTMSFKFDMKNAENSNTSQNHIQLLKQIKISYLDAKSIIIYI